VLNGGIVTGNNTSSNALRADLLMGSSGPVSVNGATLGTWTSTTSATSTLTIIVGIFEMDPTNYLAEGSVCNQANGLYTVTTAVCTEHANGTALTLTKLAEYLEDGAYILPEGTYYLAGDMTVANQFKISSGTVTLCLNGNTLTNNYVNAASSTDGLFRVSGGELIITDTAEGGGVIDGAAKYRFAYMDGGKVTLRAGTIQNFAYANGGVVRMGKAGTFLMEGGTITGNKATGAPSLGGVFHMGSGGTVEIRGGYVYVNGDKIEEPYVLEQGISGVMEKVVVPEDCLFCCGDNREVSVDSRKDEVGFVSKDQIVGKVIIRLFPFNSIQTF